jgi:hypothetical protein
MSLMPMPPAPPAFVHPEPCLYRISYVRLTSGDNFWYYPTSIERDLVSGYRWYGVYWRYFQFNRIYLASMNCPPIPTLF